MKQQSEGERITNKRMAKENIQLLSQSDKSFSKFYDFQKDSLSIFKSEPDLKIVIA